MANNLAKNVEYIINALDLVYKKGSVTAALDGQNSVVVDKINSNNGEVKIPKLSFDGGLKDYSRASGANTGDVTMTWQTLALQRDRARQFKIDRAENIENATIALANMSSEFLRQYVIPELDAYRLSKYAASAESGNVTTATLTVSTIRGAIEDAQTSLLEAEVPLSNMILFANYPTYSLIKQAWGADRIVSGSTVNEHLVSIDGLQIAPVPSARMRESYTWTAGMVGSGAQIDFILMDKSVAIQAMKFIANKLFTPDENIISDSYLWRLRLYYDAFVLDNKKPGIYVSKHAVE